MGTLYDTGWQIEDIFWHAALLVFHKIQSGEVRNVYCPPLYLRSWKNKNQLDEFIWWGKPLQNSLTDFLFTIITLISACIMTTILTEPDKGDFAIGSVIDEAEEKRIINVVMVLGLVFCSQGCTDLRIIIAWETINKMTPRLLWCFVDIPFLRRLDPQ